MGVLLGIDVGTTNWKAAAFDHTGQLIALAKTPTVTRHYGEGQDFYDPAQLWADVASVIRQVVEACNGQAVDAVSVTSMAESVVPIDQSGVPCFPIIPWFDTRARAESRYLADTVGRERLFALTGLDPNPIFSLPKIMWLKAHHPDVYSQATTWLQMADYIYMQLCGAQVTDHTLATRTLAYDLHTGDWSDELLDAAAVSPDVFPIIKSSGTLINRVSRSASALTGLSQGTPVVVGGMDHPCATISAGALLGDRLLDSSGTAESFLYVTDKQSRLLDEPTGQRICSYLDPARYAIWGGIIASGASVDWAIGRLASTADWDSAGSAVDYNTIVNAAAAVPAGSNGAMYIPHLRGSGAPYWDPRDKGAFLGLRATHTAPDMMRAVFEGLSMQARMVVEMEERVAGHPVKALCAVGGGTRIGLWQQIKADVTGKTVEVPEVAEASVLGAALLAGVGVGAFANIDDAACQVDRGDTRYYEPDPANHAFYSELYTIYGQANTALMDVNAQLDGISSGKFEQ